MIYPRELGRCFPSALLLLTFLALGCRANEESTETASEPEAGPVIVDRFEVVAAQTGNALTVALNTDLPDDTIIMVGVGRSYKEKGSSELYVIDYFSERTYVRDWRSPRRIVVDHHKWKRDFEERQQSLARAGMGFTLDKIFDDVEVHFVVPVNQENPRFGRRNENLSGAALGDDTTVLKTIRREVVFEIPLEGQPPARSYGDPNSLENTVSYRVSRDTPLTSDPNPDAPLQAVAEMRVVPTSGSITIRERTLVAGTPWYRVSANDKSGNPIGEGWVNSLALIGQELERITGR